jgi:hypothetical protein
MAAFWTEMARMSGMPVPLTSYLLLPPGSQPPPFSPALVSIDEMHPMMIQQLLQEFYALENPWVAQMVAQSLGLQQIYNVNPTRQITLPSGTSHIREFDSVGLPPFNPLIHFMTVIIQGQLTTVKVIFGVHLHRWTEFVAGFLELLGGINLAGGSPLSPQVLALADPKHPDQIELNVVNPQTNVRTPVASLPTGSAYNIVLNYSYSDNSVKVDGGIQGVGIAIGQHTLSSVTRQQAGGAR